MATISMWQWWMVLFICLVICAIRNFRYKPKKCMTYNAALSEIAELTNKEKYNCVRKLYPHCDFGYDYDEQLIIYTGIYRKEDCVQ